MTCSAHLKQRTQALPRDDSGPPTEVGARRQKFAVFEGACSEVAPGLCVGGGAVAQNWETLRAAGVTHVVNCVGMLVPNCFPDELDYLTLFLMGGTFENPRARACCGCSAALVIPAPCTCSVALAIW